jgi:hypothetical protein
MTTFSWLLIGHLVADWMFQTDWMARGKRRGPLAGATLAHCVFYAAITALFLWVATRHRFDLSRTVVFAFLLLLSHWLIDGFDVATRWMRIFQQSDVHFVRVVVDQTLHFVVLALLVEFLRLG